MESTLQDTEMQQQSSPSGHRNEEPSPDLAGIFNILSDILRKQEEAATRQAIQQMELDSLIAANESTEDVYRDSTSAIFGSPTSNNTNDRRIPISSSSSPFIHNQDLHSGTINQGSQGLQSGTINHNLQSGSYNQRLQGIPTGNINAQPRVQFASQYRGSPENIQYNDPSHSHNQYNVQRRSSFAQRAANNLPSLWEGRRSTFAPNPAPNSHFTQSIIPSNALTATNKLKKLTSGHFFRWMIGMEKIINEYPHEEILISKYIHTDVVEELAAYDMSNNITG